MDDDEYEESVYLDDLSLKELQELRKKGGFGDIQYYIDKYFGYQEDKK